MWNLKIIHLLKNKSTDTEKKYWYNKEKKVLESEKYEKKRKDIAGDHAGGVDDVRTKRNPDRGTGKCCLDNWMLTSHFFPTHTLLLAKTKGFKVFC